MTAEQLARLAHETYKKLVPTFYPDANTGKLISPEILAEDIGLRIAVAKRVLAVMNRERKLTDCISECHLIDDYEQLKKDFILYVQHAVLCKSRLRDVAENNFSCTCGLKEILEVI